MTVLGALRGTVLSEEEITAPFVLHCGGNCVVSEGDIPASDIHNPRGDDRDRARQ